MHPEVLLSGRRLNDRLHEEIARMCIKQLMASEKGPEDSQNSLSGVDL